MVKGRFISLLAIMAALMAMPAAADGLELAARYESGLFDVDGGVMEIVDYAPVQKKAYSVNGKTGMLAIISYDGTGKLKAEDYDVRGAVEKADPSFSYGDMTSVAVSPDSSRLAVALQAKAYDERGRAAVFAINDDGSLSLRVIAVTGVQPDMIVFADNNTILTADEGEPRMGYQAEDPKGSATVVDLSVPSSMIITFDRFNWNRSDLVDDGIIIRKGSMPSTDFEPEYIAVSGDRAYITLQENNAIAILDIPGRRFVSIQSAGFEDYGKVPVDLDKKDKAYSPALYEGVMGIRMPDGIAAFTSDGETFLITANEGDSREWGNHVNEVEVDFGDGESSPRGNITAESGISGKVVFFDADSYDGLDDETDYIFGGRSATLYKVDGDTISEMVTTGSDFESITAESLPEYFNASNDNAVMDDRSGKKGPEPESVTVGEADGRTLAFVALERTGGIMEYDVTDPYAPAFLSYTNTRDFTSTVEGSEIYEDGELDKWVTGGDVAPEGLAFISREESPSGLPLLLVASEVSGTVAAFIVE